VAPSLGLLKCHLQVPDFLLGVPQVAVELLFAIAETYKTSKSPFHMKTSTLLEQDYQCKIQSYQWSKN
jgi:hypothetical protein